MKTWNEAARKRFWLAVGIVIVACSGLSTPASNQPQVIPPSPVLAETPLEFTATPVQALTQTPESAPENAITPSLTPTLTAIPSPTHTNTPLPPLNFDQLINFGGGGGGGLTGVGYCHEYEFTHTVPNPAIFGTSITVGTNHTERMAALCFRGIKPNLPFSVRIVSPDGLTVLSGTFHADANNLFLAGYPVAMGEITTLGDGEPLGMAVIYWPIGLPFGQWRVYAQGDGLQAEGIFDAPVVDAEFGIDRSQEIGIPEAGARSNLMPGSEVHEVKTEANGSLPIVGAGFAPNESVYILLFEQTVSDESFDMPWRPVYQTQGRADSSGLLSMSMPGPFWGGDDYLLVSASGSSSLVQGNTHRLDQADSKIGFERFYVIPAASCPGAPVQRMVVNAYGSVCTQSDAVVVRDEPSRSADVILRLNPGTTFRVLGGPSCSDSWSWWKILIDGKPNLVGWIAEGGDAIDPYFICPLN